MKKITEEGHERYYKIMLFLNLFGETLVIKEYGNTANKAPTRVLEKAFQFWSDGEKEAKKTIKKRMANGYHIAFDSKRKP